MNRNAGGMDLGKTGIGKQCAFLIGPVAGGDIAGHGIGGKEKDIAVAAGAKDNGIGAMALDFSGNQIPDHDAPGLSVHQNQIQHFPAGEHLHFACRYLAAQGAVGPQQQLLAGLAPGVKRPGNLGAAKAAVGQKSAVFPGKGNALGHALIDDIAADLRQAIDIGFPGPEVAALDRVVKEPPDAVSVVLVVFGSVDAALGRDAVGAARGILNAEAFDIVAQLRQRCRGCAAGKTGSDDNDLKFTFVGGVDQFQLKLMPVPFVSERPPGNFCI